MTFCLICLKESPMGMIEYIGLTLCDEHYLKIKRGIAESEHTIRTKKKKTKTP